VPKPGKALDAEVLRGFLAGRLASFKIPTRVRVYGEQLPRNPAGKILKRALRDELVAAGG
jgi:acyl-CoA synthetase (AMP-forming)/AMP-acid ligase II